MFASLNDSEAPRTKRPRMGSLGVTSEGDRPGPGRLQVVDDVLGLELQYEKCMYYIQVIHADRSLSYIQSS